MSQFFNPFEGANGGGGTSDYNELTNKPSINSVPLTGNKSLADLGIVNTIVDNELSTTSENPVQNKIITQAINEKLSIDDAVGKNVTGTEYTIDGQTVVAAEGAEIFNNYRGNKATGYCSHAEGGNTLATGNYSHSEGSASHAGGASSHAEGRIAVATGDYSHAEGSWTHATGSSSHAEGNGTYAAGTGSHAEGESTQANGYCSHTEGSDTQATGDYSHAEGQGTIAATNQHVQGKYNIAQGDLNTEMAFIIGNGTSDQNRSNAFSIDWDGNIYVNGDTTGVNVSTVSSTLATISSILTPMSESEYDAITTKDKPLYFIYD